MFWEDWSEANLEVAMFETDSAEVGFHILYGEVDVEIGITYNQNKQNTNMAT